MVKPLIAIDIDDVLADNARGFTQFSNERWGTHLEPSDYEEHWAHMWQVDNAEAERRAAEFHESGSLGRYGHNLHAYDVLTKLKETYDFVIITSRRLIAKDETITWIADRFPDLFKDDQIYFAGIWDDGISEGRYARTKGDLIKGLSVNYLIDDQLKHCLSASEQQVPSLLFGDYSWNQSDTLSSNITRVKDWAEVLEYFSGRTV
jgi:5'(3')-deoxyribonucleotidase